MEQSIPESACPVCRTVLDRTQCVSNYQFTHARPQPGSLAVCGCGTALKFNTDLTLSELDPIALIEIAVQSPEVYQQLMAIRGITAEVKQKRSRSTRSRLVRSHRFSS